MNMQCNVGRMVLTKKWLCSVGGMILSKVNSSPPQIPHVLAWDRTQASAVRGWLLMTGPWHSPNYSITVCWP